MENREECADPIHMQHQADCAGYHHAAPATSPIPLQITVNILVGGQWERPHRQLPWVVEMLVLNPPGFLNQHLQ